jgi:hypothetical protein
MYTKGRKPSGLTLLPEAAVKYAGLGPGTDTTGTSSAGEFGPPGAEPGLGADGLKVQPPVAFGVGQRSGGVVPLPVNGIEIQATGAIPQSFLNVTAVQATATQRGGRDPSEERGFPAGGGYGAGGPIGMSPGGPVGISPGGLIVPVDDEDEDGPILIPAEPKKETPPREDPPPEEDDDYVEPPHWKYDTLDDSEFAKEMWQEEEEQFLDLAEWYRDEKADDAKWTSLGFPAKERDMSLEESVERKLDNKRVDVKDPAPDPKPPTAFFGKPGSENVGDPYRTAQVRLSSEDKWFLWGIITNDELSYEEAVAEIHRKMREKGASPRHR